MLVGTTDFYHFMPLSVTLTLTGNQNASANKSWRFHFLALFSTELDEICYSDEAIQADHPETIFE